MLFASARAVGSLPPASKFRVLAPRLLSKSGQQKDARLRAWPGLKGVEKSIKIPTKAVKSSKII